jgi:ribonuclease HI
MSTPSLVNVAFTDGSVDVNKNSVFSRGAGAAVLVNGECCGAEAPCIVTKIRVVAEYMEGYDTVTNNTMELLGFGVVAAKTPEGDPMSIWSDSRYALGVLFNPKWRVGQNRSQILAIRKQFKGRDVTTRHIPGHSHYFLNELADLVANRSVGRKQNIDYTLDLAKGTHLNCLSCKRFPCEIPKDQWKIAFESIRDRSWQVCGRLDQYATFSSGSNGSNRKGDPS